MWVTNEKVNCFSMGATCKSQEGKGLDDIDSITPCV